MHGNEDTPSWSMVGSGKFSVKFYYNAVTEDDDSEEEIWSWLWKLKIPQKLILFLWIIRHGKNLSNHHRLIRGMDTDGNCKLCGVTETNNHIFRFYTKATMVWSSSHSPLNFDHVAVMDFRDWLDGYVKISNRVDKNPVANVHFITKI